jgi:hypothetical protein
MISMGMGENNCVNMGCFGTKHLIPEIWGRIDDDAGGLRFNFNAGS